MIKVLFLIGLLFASKVNAQSLPCNPNSGYWAFTSTTSQLNVCAPDGKSYIISGPATMPAGTITLSLTACGTGYTEVTELNGVTLIGTLAANGNVGNSGGANNITPVGSNSVPTFAGTLSTTIVNHTHTLATGTTATGNFSQVIGTVDTTSGGTGGTPTQSTLGTQTVATVGGSANYTPAGTITAPTFTGTQFDNRSAFKFVIFCRKS